MFLYFYLFPNREGVLDVMVSLMGREVDYQSLSYVVGVEPEFVAQVLEKAIPEAPLSIDALLLLSREDLSRLGVQRTNRMLVDDDETTFISSSGSSFEETFGGDGIGEYVPKIQTFRPPNEGALPGSVEVDNVTSLEGARNARELVLDHVRNGYMGTVDISLRRGDAHSASERVSYSHSTGVLTLEWDGARGGSRSSFNALICTLKEMGVRKAPAKSTDSDRLVKQLEGRANVLGKRGARTAA